MCSSGFSSWPYTFHFGAIRYLIVVGRKKHTIGVIVGLSELGIKKVMSHMRKDIILFFSIPAQLKLTVLYVTLLNLISLRMFLKCQQLETGIISLRGIIPLCLESMGR